MITWRESASQETQDELDGLVGVALELAQEQLRKYGEFFPYAIALTRDGEHKLVDAAWAEGHRESAAIIAALVEALAEHREDFRAVGIVADTHLPQQMTDAIRVTLEHREGTHLAVLLPYRLRQDGHGIDVGELQAVSVTPSIWL